MSPKQINELMHAKLCDARSGVIIEALTNFLHRRPNSKDYQNLASHYATHNGQIVEHVYCYSEPVGVLQLIWEDTNVDFTKNVVKFTYQFTPALNGKFILK